MTKTGPDLPSRPDWAVIDIGSNSVRLVMYEGPATSPLMVFNEKVLCGLGARDPATNRLRPEAAGDALHVLRRFAHLLAQAEPKSLDVFATAAARDAEDGDVFMAAVRDLGFSPQLMSGEEEARLAALGILSGAPQILKNEGGALAGDIGGGSLELSQIVNDPAAPITERTSLPLGGLRLATQFHDDRQGAQKNADAVLDDLPWLAESPSRDFYVVGGAWRGLARIAMDERAHPLEILDQFTLSRDDAMALANWIAKEEVPVLEAMPCVQRRRAPTLPYAAIVLRSVLERTKVERLVVSAHGVREGIIYDKLDEEARRVDPLLSLAQYTAERFGAAVRPAADRLLSFLAPAFPKTDLQTDRLYRAAAIMANASQHFHPDERGMQAATMVMSLPFRGLRHEDRVALALMLTYRHGGNIGHVERQLPISLIDDEAHQRARAIGLGFRFAISLDPSSRHYGSALRLRRESDDLILSFSGIGRELWGRTPAKRFSRFADALGCLPELEGGDHGLSMVSEK